MNFGIHSKKKACTKPKFSRRPSAYRISDFLFSDYFSKVYIVFCLNGYHINTGSQA